MPSASPAKIAARLVAAGLLTLVAACGTSAPRQAAVAPPAAVAPATAPPSTASPSVAAPEQPASRRAQRRAGRGEQEGTEAGTDPALELIPEAAALGYDRALSALHSENWLEAELELEALTAEYSHYPGPHVNLALVYLHDGRRADARAALDRALAIDAGHAAANTQLGVLLREDGDFAGAERAYRRALETDSAHAVAHRNLGILLDVYLRRPAEALEHYELYQSSLADPDETVGRWIVELRRRTGGPSSGAPRVAQGDGT